MLHEVLCEPLHDALEFCLADFDDTHHRRPTEAVDAEKAVTKSLSGFSSQFRGILFGKRKCERTGYRQFICLSGFFVHMVIAGVKAGNLQKFHTVSEKNGRLIARPPVSFPPIFLSDSADEHPPLRHWASHWNGPPAQAGCPWRFHPRTTDHGVASPNSRRHAPWPCLQTHLQCRVCRCRHAPETGPSIEWLQSNARPEQTTCPCGFDPTAGSRAQNH